MSSAYSSILTVPSDVSTPAFNFLISVARSLRKTEKRVGDRLSPCQIIKPVFNRLLKGPPKMCFQDGFYCVVQVKHKTRIFTQK